MNQHITTDPTKFYTVSGLSRWGNSSDGDQIDLVDIPGIHFTIDEAAQAVATVVNEILMNNGSKRRVNVKNCYDGYTLDIDAGHWEYSIVAHDRPWIVTHMNCDDRTVDYTLHHTQADAKREVTVEAKQVIAEEGKGEIEYVYADRNGECEIELSGIKKAERYLLIDTLGGNRIDITAQQL